MLYSISMRDAGHAGRIKTSYMVISRRSCWDGCGEIFGLLRTLSSSSTCSSSVGCSSASLAVSIGRRAFDIFKIDYTPLRKTTLMHKIPSYPSSILFLLKHEYARIRRNIPNADTLAGEELNQTTIKRKKNIPSSLIVVTIIIIIIEIQTNHSIILPDSDPGPDPGPASEPSSTPTHPGIRTHGHDQQSPDKRCRIPQASKTGSRIALLPSHQVQAQLFSFPLSHRGGKQKGQVKQKAKNGIMHGMHWPFGGSGFVTLPPIP